MIGWQLHKAEPRATGMGMVHRYQYNPAVYPYASESQLEDGNFKGTTVPRGSFVSSIGKLSGETGLTEREIRTAISHLKKTGEVTSKTTNKFTVFTVVKYDLYQTTDKQNDRQPTGNRHSNDIQTTTIEEKKEGKKERNTPPISPVERLQILPQPIQKPALVIWQRRNTAMRLMPECRKLA